MSKENVRKFYETLKSDQALAEELQNTLKAAKAETAEQVKAVTLQFAAQQNLDITADELAAFEMEARKLSNEELDQVNAAAGSGSGGDPIENLAVEKICLLMDMVVIPSGTFQMGSTGDFEEYPVHTVTISKSFCLGKYEVTQAQWEKVMGNNPSKFRGDNRPVECVSWDDAKKFCNKLNQQLKDKLPAGYHFDLPTEAQWEYACRAGSTGEYSGGTIDEVAWYTGNSGNETHKVGEKEPNAWGMYDMHGNVWEWCRDWYDSYPSKSVTDPVGLVGSFRVLRGGSWDCDAGHCRTVLRYFDLADDRNRDIGFRLALVPVQ